MEPPSTSTAILTCLCGKVKEPGSLLKAPAFPIPSALCSCNSCRYNTGNLLPSFATLKQSPSEATLSACKRYPSSQILNRYFCATCGTNTFAQYINKNSDTLSWISYSGIIDRTDHRRDIDTIKPRMVEWVDDTTDGGLVKRMFEVMKLGELQNSFPLHAGDEDKTPAISWEEANTLWSSSSDQPQKEDNVPILCHCTSVKLYLYPPDLSKDRRFPSAIQDWPLFTSDGKYWAKHCACRYCRLGSSSPLAAWCYPLFANIRTETGEMLAFNGENSFTNVPGLTCYQSTKAADPNEHQWRSFCSTCGATVLAHMGTRPQVVNVAPGLIRAGEGCLAENWLEWIWDSASWEEGCRDTTLLQLVTGKKNKGENQPQ